MEYEGQNTVVKADEEQTETRINPVKEIVSFVVTTAVFIVIFLLIVQFVARPIVVQYHSMENTCQNGDYLIVWELGYSPKKGDIVVTTEENPLHERLIKRVIATGGDHVQIQNGTLTLNGTVQEETYLKDQTWGASDQIDLTIPEGNVFLMGDNRNDSMDSRAFGVIEEKSVMGKAVFRLFPFNKIGVLES